MSSNPRKRSADVESRSLTVPKLSKLSSSDDVSTASEDRRKSILKPHSKRQRQIPSVPVPHRQRDFNRDFNSYAPGTPLNRQVVPSDAAKASARVDSSLSTRRPAPPKSHPGRPQAQIGTIQPIVYKRAIMHPPHPASRIGYNNHCVPYPLGLMPYESWNRLHHGSDLERIPFISCPVCGGKREALAHVRKLFLVAERLTWEEGLVSMTEKNRNANLNNKLNHELNIRGPFIDYQEHVRGGKHSKTNKFHPYDNEHEMKLAFKLLFMTNNLTKAAWELWIGTQLHMEKTPEGDGAAGSLSVEGITGRTEAPKTTSSLSGLLTPPLSSKEEIRRTKIPASTSL